MTIKRDKKFKKILIKNTGGNMKKFILITIALIGFSILSKEAIAKDIFKGTIVETLQKYQDKVKKNQEKEKEESHNRIYKNTILGTLKKYQENQEIKKEIALSHLIEMRIAILKAQNTALKAITKEDIDHKKVSEIIKHKQSEIEDEMLLLSN